LSHGHEEAQLEPAVPHLNPGALSGVTPKERRLGLELLQRQIATDSAMHSPSSSSRTGIEPSEFFLRKSSLFCSRARRSTWTLGTVISFSARKMRTRRGFGARWLS